MEIVKFKRRKIINGFTVKRGFIGAFINRRLVAVSSGYSFTDKGYTSTVKIYRRENHSWVGDLYTCYEGSAAIYRVWEEVAANNADFWAFYGRSKWEEYWK